MAAADSVLVIAFGGPVAPADVRPFLERVARGRRIPPGRLEAVASHYAQLPGGGSPINALTRAQADALGAALACPGPALAVYVGQRNWRPFLADALGEMAARGHRRAVGLIMSALRSAASWDRYVEDVAVARAATPGAPEIVFAPPFTRHPGFIAAVADRARGALDEVPPSERSAAPLVFTAHSVPVAMAHASPYVEDMGALCRAVTARLGRARWAIAWQSRSGAPDDPWLEPGLEDVLADLAAAGARHVVVVPAGFVCDNVEVLYDLDVEARALAARRCLTLHRAGTVNDHPEFIAALADVVREVA